MSACKLNEQIDWSMQPIHVLTLVLAVLAMPLSWYLPIEYGYENGVVEHTQMTVLLLGIVLALTSKRHREICIFSVLVLLLLITREINAGRTIFFPKDEPNYFYKWKELPSHYKMIAYSIYGIIVAAAGAYFLYARVWKKGWELLKNHMLPVWNFVLILMGVCVGITAEKNNHMSGTLEGAQRMMTVEEAAELVVYLGLVIFIYLFSRGRLRSAGCCTELPKE